MGTVYSVPIFERTGGSSTGVVVYTVPAGKVTVVRTVVATSEVATAGDIALLINGSGHPYGICLKPPATVRAQVQWEGRWVLTAGQEIKLIQQTGPSSVSIWASGYELATP